MKLIFELYIPVNNNTLNCAGCIHGEERHEYDSHGQRSETFYRCEILHKIAWISPILNNCKFLLFKKL
jgi:hypothetical protein